LAELTVTARYSRKPFVNHDPGGKGIKSRFWLFVGIVLLVLFLWDVAGPYGLWKLHRIRNEREQLYMANMEITKDNAVLKKYLDEILKDPRLQEKILRYGLGWVRDGDIIYKFAGDGPR